MANKLLESKKIRNALIELVQLTDPDKGSLFWRVNIEVPGRRTSAPYRDYKDAKNSYNEKVETLSVFGTMYD